MWNIIDKGSYKLFVNKQIELKLKVYEKEKCNEIFVNYKGYNIVFAMEAWGFGSECMEWNIHEEMGGDPMKDPSSMFFIIDLADTRAFIDLIYFFITENKGDGMLREECRVSWLK